jgi:metacaspase-1
LRVQGERLDHGPTVDAGRPNGAFTFVALNALKRLPKSATYQGWFDAIRKLLPSRQYPQSPNLYGIASLKRGLALA